MPYENEHACRLRDPGDFQADSFRRTSRQHDGKSYDVIQGKLKGEDSMTDQAFRYKKDSWTASQAKAHCKEHDGSFEAAKDSKGEIPEGIERRIMPPADSEFRVDGDEDHPKLVGYAAKFGQWTDLGWFREKIKAGAFDDALADGDVRCLKNHDPNLILGRTTSGTLRLSTNTVGLRFENDLPDTNTGRDIREEVRRGDISGCSFAFTVAEDLWKYFDDDTPPERTIVKIARLFDVGPVTFPAYPDTTVAARSCNEQRASKISHDGFLSVEDIKQREQRQEVSPDRMRQIRRVYKKCLRLIARNRPAEDRSAASGRGSDQGETVRKVQQE